MSIRFPRACGGGRAVVVYRAVLLPILLQSTHLDACFLALRAPEKVITWLKSINIPIGLTERVREPSFFQQFYHDMMNGFDGVGNLGDVARQRGTIPSPP